MSTWIATVALDGVIVSRRTLPREPTAVRLDTVRDLSWTFDTHHVRRDDDGREWIVLHVADHGSQRVGRLVITTRLTGAADEVTPPHTVEIPATDTEPMIAATITVEEPN